MYGKFAIALPPEMIRPMTSGAPSGVWAWPLEATVARTPAATGWRAPRLNALTARSICLSSLRISASDGAPGEISEPSARLTLRFGAAGALLGSGACLAPRVPAGSGKLSFSSGSRVRTTPSAVGCGVGALAPTFGVAGDAAVLGASVFAPPHPDSASTPTMAPARPSPGGAPRQRRRKRRAGPEPVG